MLLKPNEVKIKKVSQDGNSAVFSFGPLPAGFGHTLGNTLRRVLLTSLKGAAISQLKIPSVSHKFTTIPGVKEDVVELCLNLKQVVVKSHSDEPVVASISKKGKGPVKASDIEVSSEVEIVNKGLHIAELADKNSKLEVDLVIDAGVGYVSSKDRSTSKVGVILLDSLYSPVLAVSYDVQATRKGDIVGLDKLILTISTNGAVSPEDAVTEASTLLRGFFAKFGDGTDDDIVVESAAVEEEVTQSDDVYLEDLSLPTRTINALKRQDISTLSQLAALSDEELSDIKNLGDKSVVEIRKLLQKEGLR